MYFSDNLNNETTIERKRQKQQEYHRALENDTKQRNSLKMQLNDPSSNISNPVHHPHPPIIPNPSNPSNNSKLPPLMNKQINYSENNEPLQQLQQQQQQPQPQQQPESDLQFLYDKLEFLERQQHNTSQKLHQMEEFLASNSEQFLQQKKDPFPLPQQDHQQEVASILRDSRKLKSKVEELQVIMTSEIKSRNISEDTLQKQIERIILQLQQFQQIQQQQASQQQQHEKNQSENLFSENIFTQKLQQITEKCETFEELLENEKKLSENRFNDVLKSIDMLTAESNQKNEANEKFLNNFSENMKFEFQTLFKNQRTESDNQIQSLQSDLNLIQKNISKTEANVKHLLKSNTTELKNELNFKNEELFSEIRQILSAEITSRRTAISKLTINFKELEQIQTDFGCQLQKITKEFSEQFITLQNKIENAFKSVQITQIKSNKTINEVSIKLNFTENNLKELKEEFFLDRSEKKQWMERSEKGFQIEVEKRRQLEKEIMKLETEMKRNLTELKNYSEELMKEMKDLLLTEMKVQETATKDSFEKIQLQFNEQMLKVNNQLHTHQIELERSNLEMKRNEENTNERFNQLTTELNTQQTELGRHDSELKKHEENLTQLVQKSNQMTEQIERTVENLEKLTEKSDQFVNQFNSQQIEIEANKEQIEKENQKSDQLTNELQQITQITSSQEEKLQKNEQKFIEIATKLITFQTEYETFLKSYSQEQEEKLVKLQSIHEERHQETQLQLQQSKNDLTNDIQAINKKITEQLNNHQQQLTDLEEKLKELAVAPASAPVGMNEEEVLIDVPPVQQSLEEEPQQQEEEFQMFQHQYDEPQQQQQEQQQEQEEQEANNNNDNNNADLNSTILSSNQLTPEVTIIVNRLIGELVEQNIEKLLPQKLSSAISESLLMTASASHPSLHENFGELNNNNSDGGEQEQTEQQLQTETEFSKQIEKIQLQLNQHQTIIEQFNNSIVENVMKDMVDTIAEKELISVLDTSFENMKIDFNFKLLNKTQMMNETMNRIQTEQTSLNSKITKYDMVYVSNRLVDLEKKIEELNETVEIYRKDSEKL